VSALLAMPGIDVNVRTTKPGAPPSTALSLAAARGRVDIVRQLLAAQAASDWPAVVWVARVLLMAVFVATVYYFEIRKR
jgi:hypothetical protein